MAAFTEPDIMRAIWSGSSDRKVLRINPGCGLCGLCTRHKARSAAGTSRGSERVWRFVLCAGFDFFVDVHSDPSLVCSL